MTFTGLIISLSLAAGAGAPPASPRHGDAFDDVDRWVRIFESPKRTLWQKPAEVMGALRVRRGQAVADVGAGTGYFALPLGRAVGRSGVVYAIDLSAPMLRFIEQRAVKEKAPMVRTVQSRPDDPKIPAPVDLIFICNTWHYLEDRVAYARRLAKKLKRKGRVAIVDWYADRTPIGPRVETRVSGRTVVAEMKAAGFSVAERFEFLPFHYFIVFRKSS